VRRSIFVALAWVGAASSPVVLAEAPDTSPGRAIQLVLETQQDKIQSVDNPADSSHDTKERSWSVKRPVEPGVLDTTHTFTVTYRIDGVSVASWQVDTKAGTAVRQP